MGRVSAGLLMYRTGPMGRCEVLLVHPGGPFWRSKDLGAWSIPKGEFTNEEPLEAARREFFEETGCEPQGPFKPLTPVRQAGGKLVSAWAFEGDWDPAQLRSNTFRVELPKGSGKFRTFPEVDRAAWFDLPEARRRINEGQKPLLDQLEAELSGTREGRERETKR